MLLPPAPKQRSSKALRQQLAKSGDESESESFVQKNHKKNEDYTFYKKTKSHHEYCGTPPKKHLDHGAFLVG